MMMIYLFPRRYDLALSLAFQGQGADDTKMLSRHMQRALHCWEGLTTTSGPLGLPPDSCLVTSLPGACDVEDGGGGGGEVNLFGAS